MGLNKENLNHLSNEKKIMSYFPPPNPLKGVYATVK